ncbi:MAG: glycosyltransferase family 2 protein [Planctomycetaceae bacterium]
MFVSVIISTYESPAWLEKTLWGYRSQTHGDFDVLVADDGSGAETACVIERMRRASRLRIRHVWHPDVGFRKCRILNRAIAESRGEYLIFTDGDCVPRSDFVATHAALAHRGRGLSGGCIRLPLDASRALSEQDVFSGRCMRGAWLRAHTATTVGGRLRLRAADVIAGWIRDGLTTTRATFNGHNSSVWRADALRVNGFDERMTYGGLDREFGERLVNAGVRFRQVRHRAICLHLAHGRPYASEDSWARNAAIRTRTRRERLAWTPHGIESSVTPLRRVAA